MLGSSKFRESAESGTTRFSCALNKTLDFLGNCIEPENNRKEWKTNWNVCKNGQRARKYRLFSSIPKAADSTSTHFDLKIGPTVAVKESCNNPNVRCSEEHAVYSNSTKTCEPQEGFNRTSFGILPQSVEKLGDDIISEVTKRINRLFWVVARADLVKFDRMTKTLKDAEDDMMKKVKRACGKTSQRLNPRLYEELKIMHDTLQNTIKPSSSNIDALRKAIKLLNRYQQNTIFNCPKSGYGPDPTDEEDSGGVTCVEGKASAGGNMNLYHKCKIMLRMKNIFEQTLLVQF